MFESLKSCLLFFVLRPPCTCVWFLSIPTRVFIKNSFYLDFHLGQVCQWHTTTWISRTRLFRERTKSAFKLAIGRTNQWMKISSVTLGKSSSFFAPFQGQLNGSISCMEMDPLSIIYSSLWVVIHAGSCCSGYVNTEKQDKSLYED